MTAGDPIIRPEHAKLDRITLPASSVFWNSGYPPNGYNCRCTAFAAPSAEATSDEKESLEKLKDIFKKQNAIFKFNSGKSGNIFPLNHPYFNVSSSERKAVKQALKDFLK